MAADFMAQPVQFRNSVFIWLLTVFCACNTNTPHKARVHQPVLVLNKANVYTTMVNGILIVNHQPYSGALYTLYAGTSDTAEVIRYLNGKEHGEWKKYYPLKKIKEVRFFSNGQKVGHYTAWWPNGARQLHYFFKADEYDGECREWNDQGLLTKVMHYKKGYEEGAQQWWYDNGKIKANYMIKDGRRYGLLGTKNCTNAADKIFDN